MLLFIRFACSEIASLLLASLIFISIQFNSIVGGFDSVVVGVAMLHLCRPGDSLCPNGSSDQLFWGSNIN